MTVSFRPSSTKPAEDAAAQWAKLKPKVHAAAVRYLGRKSEVRLR